MLGAGKAMTFIVVFISSFSFVKVYFTLRLMIRLIFKFLLCEILTTNQINEIAKCYNGKIYNLIET